MRKLTTFILILFCFNLLAQDSDHEVRRTIGVNFTPLNASDDHPYFRSKFGLIYRQCFKSYVLQVELNKQWQGHDYFKQNTSPVFVNSDTVYNFTSDFSPKNMNLMQIGLMKGWTNDFSNLYFGFSINGGIAKESARYSELYYTSYTDSLTGEVYSYPLNEMSIHGAYYPKYFKIGLVMSASIELRVSKKLSAILQISPEFSWFWKMNYKKIDEREEELFPSNYKQMTHNGIEISLNYKL